MTRQTFSAFKQEQREAFLLVQKFKHTKDCATRKHYENVPRFDCDCGCVDNNAAVLDMVDSLIDSAAQYVLENCIESIPKPINHLSRPPFHTPATLRAYKQCTKDCREAFLIKARQLGLLNNGG